MNLGRKRQLRHSAFDDPDESGARRLPDSNEKYSAPALEKGLDILELLAAEPEGVIKSEIARRLDRSINEIFRMLAVLERRGYISAEGGTDRYTLTLKLFRLSHRFPPIRRLGMVSAEVMRRLAFELKQSCHLSVYYSGKAHVVAQQDSPSDVIFSVRLGIELMIHTSASGKVLLAFADDDMQARMIRSVMAQDPSFTEAAAKKIIRDIRKAGFVQQPSPRTIGSIDLCFPVFDHTNQVIAALCVPYLPRQDQDSVEIDQVISMLRLAAAEMSECLGSGMFDPDD